MGFLCDFREGSREDAALGAVETMGWGSNFKIGYAIGDSHLDFVTVVVV